MQSRRPNKARKRGGEPWESWARSKDNRSHRPRSLAMARLSQLTGPPAPNQVARSLLPQSTKAMQGFSVKGCPGIGRGDMQSVLRSCSYRAAYANHRTSPADSLHGQCAMSTDRQTINRKGSWWDVAPWSPIPLNITAGV